MDNRPIGVFDSGVGGLTVVKEIIKLLPNENIVYFGDTARVPYGTKSYATITKYSMQNIRFLLAHDIKAIVVACNTASSVSLNEVQKHFDIPIIGVVEPGALAGVSSTKNKKVGVIGTKGTIRSKAFEKSIKQMDSDIETYGVACSLFISLAEEGWIDNDVAYKTAEKYLKYLKEEKVDTLILGCTHFPLLLYPISQVMENVTLINPAFETAKQLKQTLIDKDLLKEDNIKKEYKYFLSDIETNFKNIANNCLDREIENIQKVDIEQY